MDMADAFCIHCGKPLIGAKKFCTNCGRPVGGESGAKDPFPALDGQIFERLAAKVRMPVPTRLLSKPAPLLPAALRAPSLRTASPALQRSAVSGIPNPDQVSFDRVWEPNENAFTVLVPKGWKIRGGIFYVNPLQANGPGNAISPKCDFAVLSDDQGSMMMRWMPSWNYADLTCSPTGGANFPPDQWYQGMPVRLMVSARQFLSEMLQAERPRASGMTIAVEDPVNEVTAAFYKQAEPLNQSLQQAGLSPLKFESWDMVVEYSEDGQSYLEEVTTTICDNRAGACAWTNDNTFMMRAPAADFATWGSVLLQIRNSLETNQQWLAAVEKSRGERARIDWETQQYINKVIAEVIANRQKAYEEAQRKRDEDAPAPGADGGGDSME
jgi:hypothetical protein